MLRFIHMALPMLHIYTTFYIDEPKTEKKKSPHLIPVQFLTNTSRQPAAPRFVHSFLILIALRPDKKSVQVCVVISSPRLRPRWPLCPCDVWARWRGEASQCECATPAPEKHRVKQEWDGFLPMSHQSKQKYRGHSGVYKQRINRDFHYLLHKQKTVQQPQKIQLSKPYLHKAATLSYFQASFMSQVWFNAFSFRLEV